MFLPNLSQRFKALVDHLATVALEHVDKARGILQELVGRTDSAACVVGWRGTLPDGRIVRELFWSGRAGPRT